MSNAIIEIVQVGPQHADALALFFEALEAAGAGALFHPHPLTAEAARERAAYRGNDIYCVAVDGGRVLGYGMLRGWDEGYQIPSLGIAIHPEAQAQGLGRLLMHYLHVAASRRGAEKIRLRLHPHNQIALGLYRSLGYAFSEEPKGPYLVGYRDLRDLRRR